MHPDSARRPAPDRIRRGPPDRKQGDVELLPGGEVHRGRTTAILVVKFMALEHGPKRRGLVLNDRAAPRTEDWLRPAPSAGPALERIEALLPPAMPSTRIATTPMPSASRLTACSAFAYRGGEGRTAGRAISSSSTPDEIHDGRAGAAAGFPPTAWPMSEPRPGPRQPSDARRRQACPFVRSPVSTDPRLGRGRFRLALRRSRPAARGARGRSVSWVGAGRCLWLALDPSARPAGRCRRGCALGRRSGSAVPRRASRPAPSPSAELEGDHWPRPLRARPATSARASAPSPYRYLVHADGSTRRASFDARRAFGCRCRAGPAGFADQSHLTRQFPQRLWPAAGGAGAAIHLAARPAALAPGLSAPPSCKSPTPPPVGPAASGQPSR